MCRWPRNSSARGCRHSKMALFDPGAGLPHGMASRPKWMPVQPVAVGGFRPAQHGLSCRPAMTPATPASRYRPGRSSPANQLLQQGGQGLIPNRVSATGGHEYRHPAKVAAPFPAPSSGDAVIIVGRPGDPSDAEWAQVRSSPVSPLSWSGCVGATILRASA
jgi:hypothetical protein